MKKRASSSREIVLNDEDLLTLILLRVPFTQLVLLKSVSKRWLSLVTNPHFIHLLRRSLPPLRASSLLIQRTTKSSFQYRYGTHNQVFCIPLDNPNAGSPFRNSNFFAPCPRSNPHLVQSCNGLALYNTPRLRGFEDCKRHVYNPSTAHLDTLPNLPPFYGRGGLYIGLTYDPSKSPHYKVVAFFFTQDQYGDFLIYSSETGNWKVSIQSFYQPFGFLFCKKGVYWNGCLHWLYILSQSQKNIPDSPVSDCLFFNVDEERLGTFPRPPIGARGTLTRTYYFGESEGHLHVTEVFSYATSLNIYEMKNDYSGWFVKYRVDLAPIAKVYSEMTKHMSLFYDKSDYAVSVLSLVRRENFREDSFLVLEIPGKVIRYNLMDTSFKLLWDFGVTSNLKKIDHWVLGDFKVFPYMEPVLCAELQHAAARDARS